MTDSSVPAPWEDGDAETWNPTAGPDAPSAVADDEPIPPEAAPLIDEIALEFIGSWNRLVSQTNWEKGKVIHTWRTRLQEAGLPRSVYSDESLSRQIGNVSSQHVGRLRRVFEQFGDAQVWRENPKFANLYWSHYQAALDWDDAELWLEKASKEGLSVALMRIERWKKQGSPAGRKPKESDIVPSEPDEDVNPMNDSDRNDRVDVGSFDAEPGEGDDSDDKKKKKPAEDEEADAFDYSDDAEIKAELAQAGIGEGTPAPRGSDDPWSPSGRTTGEILKALADYPRLPSDLADPIEAMKIALLNYRIAQWEDVPRESILKWLIALRDLVLAEDE